MSGSLRAWPTSLTGRHAGIRGGELGLLGTQLLSGRFLSPHHLPDRCEAVLLVPVRAGFLNQFYSFIHSFTCLLTYLVVEIYVFWSLISPSCITSAENQRLLGKRLLCVTSLWSPRVRLGWFGGGRHRPGHACLLCRAWAWWTATTSRLPTPCTTWPPCVSWARRSAGRVPSSCPSQSSAR